MFWTKPRFKHHFRVDVVAEENAVFLLAEKEHFVLKGDAYVAVAPLLNGKHSLDAIVSALSGRVTAAVIWHALTELEKKGYITEECDTLDSGQAAFWSALGIDPTQAEKRLAKTKVMVRALGGLSTAVFSALLQSIGIQTANEEGEVLAVLTDDYLRDELADIQREAGVRGIPWLMVKPVGTEVYAGPLFIPGQTACWECLAARLKGNLLVEQAVGRMAGRVTVIPDPAGAFPLAEQAALNLAALELAKWIVDDKQQKIAGTLITFDMIKHETGLHSVQRLPQCPDCGQAGLMEARPLGLASRLKTYTIDGGHRVHRPEETYRQYAHLVDPLTGLVKEVTRMRPEESSVHLYFAGENRAMLGSQYNLKRLKASLRSNSAGKGMTDAQAKTSALCEALERISGVFRGDEPIKQASYRELGEEAIHLDSCQHFSCRQYREREEINRQEITHYYVAEPFDEEAVIGWTPVWSLSQRRFRYLPAEYCYYSHPNARFARGDSNGNASGNTLEEAVLQGFFELAERDSVALWWYNRLAMPGVDIASFGEIYYAGLIAEYSQMGRELWAIDLTSDLNIPTFAAISCDAGTGSRLLFGFGSHLDPKIALSRAVTEMNQSLSILEAVNSGHAFLEDAITLKWLREANLINQSYLKPDDRTPVKKLSDYQQPFHNDLLTDVEYCRAIVEGLGLEMLVLDQTRPDIGMPVVKVIVPGLRHFWARFAPGRLYDVPVKLGWIKQAKTEAELNPIPMFW